MDAFENAVRQMSGVQRLARELERLETLRRQEATESALANLKAISGTTEAALAMEQVTRGVDFRELVAPPPSMNWHLMEEMERARAEAAEAPTARRAVLRLKEEIQRFESGLDEESEVAVRLASFGSAIIVHVDEIGFHQPNLIVLIGETEDDSPVTLIEHLSQLSFLLMRVPRRHPEEQKRAIGFRLTEEEPEGLD